jgi:hypothetical protein
MKIKKYGQIPYKVPLSCIFPTQCTYSQKLVDENFQKYITRPQKNPLKIVVIVDQDGKVKKYYLIDGHHRFLMLQKLGVRSLLVKKIARIVENPHLWDHMIHRGYAYPFNALGDHHNIPETWDKLEDDPVRYFVSKSVRKIHQDGSETGPDYPLWIKDFNKPVPLFIEQKISAYLHRTSFEFDDSILQGTNKFYQKVEEAKNLLREKDPNEIEKIGVKFCLQKKA